MNSKYTLILLTILCIYNLNGEEEKDDDMAPIKVAECQYKVVDNIYVCPTVTSGGAIPKLMQCANKMKKDFLNFCKEPPSFELLDKLREQCLEVCILPCLPTNYNMTSMLGDCDFDPAGLDITMDTFCSKKKQKLGKMCATTLFRKHKSEYMDLFNQKIHIFTKICFNFYRCYKRVKKEVKAAEAAATTEKAK